MKLNHLKLTSMLPALLMVGCIAQAGTESSQGEAVETADPPPVEIAARVAEPQNGAQTQSRVAQSTALREPSIQSVGQEPTLHRVDPGQADESGGQNEPDPVPWRPTSAAPSNVH